MRINIICLNHYFKCIFSRKLIIFKSVISYVYLFDRPPLPLPPSCLQVVCGVLEFLNKCKQRYGFEGNNLLFSVKKCLWLMASMDRPSGCFLALSAINPFILRPHLARAMSEWVSLSSGKDFEMGGRASPKSDPCSLRAYLSSRWLCGSRAGSLLPLTV